MRLLMTGSSGFLGRNTLPHLIGSGYEVHLTGLQPEFPDPLPPDCHYHQCNLLVQQQLRKLVNEIRPEAVLHLAWDVTPGKYWSSLDNLSWTAATHELFRSAAENGMKRFVGAGTCAEYDWQHEILSARETPLNPHSLYGRAKNSVRVVLEEASKQHSVSFAWGRIFLLYGPFEDTRRLVPSVVCSLLNDSVAKCSHGRQLRDFMHASDVGRAFVETLKSDFQGCLNIASGKHIEIRDVVDTISRVMGGSGKVEFGAVPLSPTEPAKLAADIRELEGLGFAPAFDLRGGLEHTINWWRALGEAPAMRLAAP